MKKNIHTHVSQLNFNYIAIELLEQLGHPDPAEIQIELIESILSIAANKWIMVSQEGYTL